MIRGYSSVREIAIPVSNRLKRGELLKITCNVESSNLSTPTIPLAFIILCSRLNMRFGKSSDFVLLEPSYNKELIY